MDALLLDQTSDITDSEGMWICSRFRFRSQIPCDTKFRWNYRLEKLRICAELGDNPHLSGVLVVTPDPRGPFSTRQQLIDIIDDPPLTPIEENWVTHVDILPVTLTG